MKNFSSLKFNSETIHKKANCEPDFFIGFKSIHKKDSKPAAAYAEKYLIYTEGPLSQDFFKKGIKYNSSLHYICQNSQDMKMKKITTKSNKKNCRCECKCTEEETEAEDSVSEDDHNDNESKSGDSEDENIDLLNMRKTARKVTPPGPAIGRDQSDSDSSALSDPGTLSYPSGHKKKEISEKKKKKVEEMKQRELRAKRNQSTDVTSVLPTEKGRKSLRRGRGGKK